MLSALWAKRLLQYTEVRICSCEINRNNRGGFNFDKSGAWVLLIQWTVQSKIKYMREDQLERHFSGYAKVKVNDFSIDIDKIECGVIFLYCTSSPTIVQLHSLLTSLKNYQQIALSVF